MSIDTVTTPSCLAEVAGRMGAEPSHYTIARNGRRRDCWTWPTAIGTAGVTLIQHCTGPRDVEVWNHADRYRAAELHLDGDPSDSDMRALLRLVGLLPPLVEVADSDGDTVWWDGAGAVKFARVGDAHPSALGWRRVFAEETP